MHQDMITIMSGMTPAEFISALNSNFTELATAWGVNQTSEAKSFDTFTVNNATPANISKNIRSLRVVYGQNASSYITEINGGFAGTEKRFQDDFSGNIIPSMTVYGEPTALVSDDGNQIDLWFTGTVLGVSNIYYSYSTDGKTYATPVKTDIPNGYMRGGIMKVGNTYYHYANGNLDTTIHCFSSTDKTHYTDLGEVIGLGGAGVWDSKNLGNTFAWKEGESYFLFYDGLKLGEYWKTGMATAFAPEGPWTKYENNPLFSGTNRDVEGAEMFRVSNEIIKHNGRYYIYINSGVSGDQGPFYDIKRFYSSDLHTWVDEGNILNVLHLEAGYISYADVAFVQFKGKSYMFNNPSNQVNAGYLDVAIDNRPLSELLALYP